MIDALKQAEAVMAACFEMPAWATSERDLVAALEATHRLEQRLAAVKLSLVRELDGRGTATAQGASSTAVWLRDRLRLGVGAARRLVEMAATLEAAPAGIREALSGGTVDLEQVRVIAETVATVQTAAGAHAADKGRRHPRRLGGAVRRRPVAQARHPDPRSRGPRSRRRRCRGGAAGAGGAGPARHRQRADLTQVVVTTSYDGLTRQVGTGALDSGLHLSAEAVRRLACDAGILPAVLDGGGQVLDVGRQRRLISGPLRRALVLRDRGCAFPGCDRPPRWCDGHHIRHWADGGDTSLDNAVLLCGHHLRHVHHSDWVVQLGGDGHREFVPPAWLDSEQVPRRNKYHRRR
ncbi:DUF222 domain-containing protein [Micromonospora taraxaci]|uniref:HNH endonuclease signature motif containing protein n=1 Tax=Micromonospora taraxaci TaxID=1316803 RepID=UPI003C2F6834